MTNFVFIDDSGPKQWMTRFDDAGIKRPLARTSGNRTFWQNNYFVLAGIHIDSEVMAKLNPLINETKEQYFGTKNAEIHSVDLRNPYSRRKKYINQYKISVERLKEFIDDFWYPLFL